MKVIVFAMKILEVGNDCLETDDTWFAPLVLRSHLHRAVVGGWSAILRRFLRHLLIGPKGFSNYGAMVRFSHEGHQCVVQIKAEILTILTDGEGHQ